MIASYSSERVSCFPPASSDEIMSGNEILGVFSFVLPGRPPWLVSTTLPILAKASDGPHARQVQPQVQDDEQHLLSGGVDFFRQCLPPNFLST